MDGNLGMGLAFSLDDQFSSGAAAIQSSFDRLRAGANTLASGIDNSMSRIYKGFGQMTAGVGLLMPLRSILKDFIEYDSLERGMTAVIGSVKSARDEIGRLKEVAKLPGLGMQEAISLSTQLQAAKVSSDLARNSLLAFGNSLAMVGKGRNELLGTVEALRKIATNGVNGMYINQISKRVPQFVGILKDVFGTAIPKEIAKMGLSGTQFIEKVVKKLNTLKRVDGGIGNAVENMNDALWKLNVSMGATFAPAVEYLANSLSDLLGTLEAFAGTKIGASIVRFAALGLAALGSSYFLRGLQNVFGGLGSVISVFSGGLGGLLTKFKAFAFANPVGLVFVAIGVAVIAATKALTAFDDYASGKTKISDGWVQFGGILKGIGEIFDSITNDGWLMSEELYNSLQKIGVLDTVLAIGTWIVRLRAMWLGFSDTISTVFEGIKGAIVDTLGYFGVHLDKLSSNLETWRKVGIVAGAAVVGILAAVVVSLLLTAGSAVIAGISMLWAFAPFIFVGALVVGALYLIYKGLGMIWEGAKWVFNGLVFWAKVAWQELVGIGIKAFMWGSDFVNNLWNGIKSVWTKLTGWLMEKWNAITGMFSSAFNIDLNGNANTNLTETGAQPLQPHQNQTYTEGGSWLDNMATQRAKSNAAPFVMAYNSQPVGANTVTNTKSEVLKNISLNLNLDGRAIHSSVNDISDMDDARSGYGGF